MPHRTARGPCRRPRSDLLCADRPRRHVRRNRLLPRLQGEGHSPGHRLRGLSCAAFAPRPRLYQRRVAQPSYPAVREHDRLQKPHSYGVARVFRRLLHEAAHRHGAAARAQRGTYLYVRVPRGRDSPCDCERQHGRSLRNLRAVPRNLRPRAFLSRNSGPRHRRAEKGKRGPVSAGERAESRPRCDERRALPDPRGRPHAGHPDGHSDGQDGR